MVTDKSIVVHVYTLCIAQTYMYSIFNNRYLTGLLQIPFLPCNHDRMLKNVSFTMRLEVAIKDFVFCKFQFQIELFRLDTVLRLLEWSFCKK